MASHNAWAGSCLLIGLLTIGGSAEAQHTTVITAPSEVRVTRAVSYADLDLATASGRKTLLRRVGSAVRSVCSEALGPSPIYYADSSCRRWSWARSQPQIDHAVGRAALGFASHGPTSSTAAAVIMVTASRRD